MIGSSGVRSEIRWCFRFRPDSERSGESERRIENSELDSERTGESGEIRQARFSQLPNARGGESAQRSIGRTQADSERSGESERRIENSELDSERTGESGEADRGPAPWSVFEAIDISSTLEL
jgi:homogentisate 1,2-dioxygenase